MKRLRKIASSKIFFFLAATFLILGLNLTPLVADLFHAPRGRSFTLIHNNAQDFFFYQALMNEGGNGAWLTRDPFTTELHKPSIIFSYFLWLGKLSNLLGLPNAIIYHLIRIILSIFFLFTIYYLLFTISIPYPRLAYFFFLFAAPFMHKISDGGKIISVPFMYWWTGIDPLRRAAYLPHHMFGGLFLVLSIIFIIKYYNKPKIKYLITLILFSSLLAFVHTPSLLILIMVLPPSAVLYFICSFKRHPERSEGSRYAAGDPSSPRLKSGLLRMTTWLSVSKFEIRNYHLIGLTLYWLIGLLLLFLMISQTSRGFPWSQYIEWEKRLQFPLYKELFFAFGILLPLSLLGLLRAAFSKNFALILTACWLIVPILFIPLAPAVNLSNIRLIQGVPYLPLSILAVLGIKTIEEMIKNSKYSSVIGSRLSVVRKMFTGLSVNQSDRQTTDKPTSENRQLKTDNRKFIGLPVRIATRSVAGGLGYWVIGLLFLIFTIPTIYWSIKDQIREYWPIFGNVYFDNRLYNAFAFIDENFPPDTIALGTFYTGNYLPAFTHTISFIGHFGYTYKTDEKQKAVRKFFENKMADQEAKDFILSNKITLVFQGPEEKPIYKDYLYPNVLKTVYDKEEVTLYVIK